MKTTEDYSSEMEARIVDAATKVFVLKGRKGASMQDIADEAGINRTLLNYYFRSKDKLFDLIFEKVFLRFIPGVVELLKTDMPLLERFEKFIEVYIEALHNSPMTPIFILHELTSNPEKLVETIKSRGIDPEYLFRQIRHEMEKKNIREMDPNQLIVSLLSLIIFP
ncbi:MAG: TetR/AcrR family transcriptional regulator, partial [Bacteroidales bacterium]|nr:TetR/AcrR family transcriptional regulator [Bacteroidales bacterium]